MKLQILAVSLLVLLAGGARAESAPISPPSTPAPPVVSPPPSSLEAQRQELESRRKALDAQQSELEANLRKLEADLRRLREVEAEARTLDLEGRLTSEQLYALLQAREQQRLADARSDPGPYVATVFFFGFLLMGFLAWQLASYRKARQLHETVRLMVEKGAEIPSGLLLPPARKKPSDLRRGIILSTTGLGLTVFLALIPDSNGVWPVGLTLFLIGAGHLLVWRLQQGRGALSAALAPEPQSLP